MNARARPFPMGVEQVHSLKANHLRRITRIVQHVGIDNTIWRSRHRNSGVRREDGAFPEAALAWCPYGQSGDFLWVQEPWAQPRTVARSDDPVRPDRPVLYKADEHVHAASWRSSITMSRWASRFLLRIDAVEGRRVHEITSEEAMEEGIVFQNGRFTFNGGLHESRTALEAFRAYFESMYGIGSWGFNHFVWSLKVSLAGESDAPR